MESVAGVAPVVRLADAALVGCAIFVPALGSLVVGITVVVVITVPDRRA